MDPGKCFAQKIQFARETNRRRASAKVWKGRSADLRQPRDYQLSVGGEMRSEWPDLQTLVKKFQKKSNPKNVKI